MEDQWLRDMQVSGVNSAGLCSRDQPPDTSATSSATRRPILWRMQDTTRFKVHPIRFPIHLKHYIIGIVHLNQSENISTNRRHHPDSAKSARSKNILNPAVRAYFYMVSSYTSAVSHELWLCSCTKK
jgi:hypothetical protein